MKIYFYTTILILVSSFGYCAGTNDFGLTLGQTMDSTTMNNSTNNDVTNGSVFGVIASGEIYGSLKLRGGFQYHSRSYGNTVSGTKYTYAFNYVEVPIGLLWQLSEYGGPFIGANIGMNLSANCSPNTCAGLVSTPIGTQFGFHGKFHPNIGGSIYYESTPAYVTAIGNETSFGVMLHIFFY